MATATISPVEKILFTRPEAAEYLCLSVRGLDEMTRDGRIQATRLGRLVRYNRRELDRVANNGIGARAS